MSEISQVKFSRKYGGEGGYTFTDYNASKVSAIEVRHGAWIDAVTVTYADGSSAKHGGKGGSASSFTLDQDEYIVKVDMKVGRQYVEEISFQTTKDRRFGPYGSGHGPTLRFDFKDKVLLGFTGRCKEFLDALGFVCGAPR
jgi:hypothetical protein